MMAEGCLIFRYYSVSTVINLPFPRIPCIYINILNLSRRLFHEQKKSFVGRSARAKKVFNLRELCINVEFQGEIWLLYS